MNLMNVADVTYYL